MAGRTEQQKHSRAYRNNFGKWPLSRRLQKALKYKVKHVVSDSALCGYRFHLDGTKMPH